MTKKNVLVVGAILSGLLLFLVFIQSGDICYSRIWCHKLWSGINLIGEMLFVFVPTLFFSLITYKMKEEVFRAWWGFARWFAPVIIVVTLLQNTAHTQSGFGGVASGAFDFALLFLLYTLFIFTSLIRIVIAYTRTK